MDVRDPLGGIAVEDDITLFLLVVFCTNVSFPLNFYGVWR